MYNIRNITLKDIGGLKEVSEKEGLLFPKVSPKFIGVYLNNELIGFGGVSLKKNRAIIKCDYVVNEHRKKCVAQYMHTRRLEMLKTMGFQYIEANATPMALRLHLNNGAKIVKEYKNGITKVAYENK